VIKTFLFDLGNVLLFFSHDRMCEQIGALCGKTGAEIRTLIFDGDKQLEFDRGTVTETEFHRWLEQETKSHISRSELQLAVADIFTPNTTMFPLLDELKARGHRLVLLSNTNSTHIEFVRQHYDLLSKFDDLVLSYEVQAVKPEAEIYQRAISRIECQPTECYYTDDIPDYITAARQHGLRGDVFTTTDSFVEQLQQYDIDLTELL